jgi:hypothetical protein
MHMLVKPWSQPVPVFCLPSGKRQDERRTLDDLPDTERELERRIPIIARIKLSAGGQAASVVHLHEADQSLLSAALVPDAPAACRHCESGSGSHRACA